MQKCPYRYVKQYADRNGQLRTYFRRPGSPSTPLPSDLESDEFLEAYKDALAARPRIVPRELLSIPADPAKRIPHGPAVGVYLLLVDGEITYVGSSRKMPLRVAMHRANGRPFDQVFYIGTSEEARLALETQLIRRLRPKQNRRGIQYVSHDREQGR
jgi:hypothetical protein